MPDSAANSGPSPDLFFQTINAFQRTEALRAAIDLDIFSAIAAGHDTAGDLGKRCGAAERGMRILCDYLVIIGFLAKEDASYSLTPDTAAFLDRGSPTYVGSTIDFLLSPDLLEAFRGLGDAVRRGGTAIEAGGTVSPENPVWVDFARAMAPLMGAAADPVAELLGVRDGDSCKVLDIAAGHGLFGISIARLNPHATVTALDWASVLEVAIENAQSAGVSDRYDTISGDAFEVDLGGGYDLVLLTNFLHHFDVQKCEGLLRKVHASLKPGGRVGTLEFVPNEDRVSPAATATFSLVMLTSTPSGDAYTFSELDAMFRNAGFARSEICDVPRSTQQLVISYR